MYNAKDIIHQGFDIMNIEGDTATIRLSENVLEDIEQAGFNPSECSVCNSFLSIGQLLEVALMIKSGASVETICLFLDEYEDSIGEFDSIKNVFFKFYVATCYTKEHLYETAVELLRNLEVISDDIAQLLDAEKVLKYIQDHFYNVFDHMAGYIIMKKA